uniref:Signal-induced proliferation-associated 1-like protein 2 n=1 Tax=Timema monikensis TaxID=170555 RepID=A0A7R9EAG6_9NEOP|nr:unnamed protein product [Timema monikensis]
MIGGGGRGGAMLEPPRGAGEHRLRAEEALYRSNSSLELVAQQLNQDTASGGGRREYGSHGSLNVLGSSSDSFFALLHDYRPAVLGADQRSPGPAEYLKGKRSPGPAEYLKGKVSPPSSLPHLGASYRRDLLHAGESSSVRKLLTCHLLIVFPQVDPVPASENASNALCEDSGGTPGCPHAAPSASPKLRLKLHRFWAGGGGGSGGKPPRHQQHQDDAGVMASDVTDERHKRRCFAHHDCQSMTANLGYAAKLRGLLLARRRNTTTGASAASMLGTGRAATPEGTDSGDEDAGDGRGNDLLESCPFFRNEIGGETERVVSLTRLPASPSKRRPLHRPPMAYGVSVLEFPSGDTHWKHGTCPYQRHGRPIESVDQGALYYRQYFHSQDHQNWFGMDDNLGPVAISIRRERLESSDSSAQYQYRLLIRTSELLTLRGSVLEEAIPNLKSPSNSKTMNTKEVLEYVAPEIQLPWVTTKSERGGKLPGAPRSKGLRLGLSSPQTEEQLLKLDEQGLTTHYKVGVMYCRSGQGTEEEMYNNEDAGPAFHEFLDAIGQRVRLKGFDKYKAGLDNKTDSTGLYSVYAQYQHCEIMFHVSTLLPFTPNNRQQLLRKRHVGNDIVTIVFQEPGALPFTPKNIRSQFQHVFIIVRAISPCSDHTQYSVAVSRSKEVPVFGPPIQEGATFPKNKTFAEFLLAKVINAENAAHRSEKFATMATRTRQEYLKDLSANYTTSIVLDTGQKFCKIKVLHANIEPCPLSILDFFLSSFIEGLMLFCRSHHVIQQQEEGAQLSSKVHPRRDATRGHLLASGVGRQWTVHSGRLLRVYHHQGECTTLHMREPSDRDELMEIVARLQAVTTGCPAKEMSLRRNPRGQLGFHVQPDGVVTQVESMGLAWQAGLRQGARLVEICKVAVSTLSHDQMVDLLKTAMMVTVTVIPPMPDGAPRIAQNCKYTASNYEGDYENLSTSSPEDGSSSPRKPQALVPGNHRRWYERNGSPPRSSNSSGYGTGSSSKSFTDSRFLPNPENTLTSSSSSHSSDDRWYELLDSTANDTNTAVVESSPPPPLPARLGSGGGPSAFQQVAPSGGKGKVQVSHSLPLPHASYSLPLTPASAVRQLDFRAPKISDYTGHQHIADTAKSSSLPPECVRGNTTVAVSASDGHSTDTSSTSERLCGARSEDELSTGSGNMSPRLRRSNKTHLSGTLTPSSGSSRNHSPRPRDTGEARLRPGVTPRSVGSNRNSANLASSTLQEDLMKLINPDYMGDSPLPDTGVIEEPQSSPVVAGKIHSSSSGSNTSSRSRENLCALQDNTAAEVIFTMARPATVISNTSTASSPAPSENKILTKEERCVCVGALVEEGLSPRVTKSLSGPKLPLPQEMDWPSLVDMATRAMQNVREEVPEAARNGESLGHWVNDVSERLGLDATPSRLCACVTGGISGRRISELQSHLVSLESRAARETRRRLSLEEEVRRLRDENRRLQEESQAAAQQLRRFTEWFFQTIDRQ